MNPEMSILPESFPSIKNTDWRYRYCRCLPVPVPVPVPSRQWHFCDPRIRPRAPQLLSNRRLQWHWCSSPEWRCRTQYRDYYVHGSHHDVTRRCALARRRRQHSLPHRLRSPHLQSTSILTTLSLLNTLATTKV
jgi:hypothetical protein